MAGDNLAGLLTPQRDSSGLSFRQGTVLTWDSASGSNQVDVAGTKLNNLTCLNIGDFVTLQTGDVVGLLYVKGSYFILGRIIPPEPPDVDRAVVAFDQATGYDSGVTLTPSAATLASCTVDVPSWADEALVTATSTVSAMNTAANGDLAMCRTDVAGLNGSTMLMHADAGERIAISTTATFLISNPASTILCEAIGQTNSGFAQTWTGDSFTAVYINATAIFRRTS